MSISSSQTNWLVVSTHLKNISQIENLPQIGVNIKKKNIETTTQQTIREKLWFSAMWSSNK